METVGTPYNLANGCPGELQASPFAPHPHPHPHLHPHPYSSSHPATAAGGVMGPALTPNNPHHPGPGSGNHHTPALPNGGAAGTTSNPTTMTNTNNTTTTTNNNNSSSNNNNNNANCPPGSVGGGAGPVAHSCCGCGRVIQDRFLLFALNHYWHTGCLKCSCCQAQLGEIGKSCYERNNMILCRNDYIRLFGSGGSCMACQQKIPPSEMVYRVQPDAVYHIKCFVCLTCRTPLQPGDRYGLVNGSLFCEQDYPKVAGGKGQGHVPPLTSRTSHKVC